MSDMQKRILAGVRDQFQDDRIEIDGSDGARLVYRVSSAHTAMRMRARGFRVANYPEVELPQDEADGGAVVWCAAAVCLTGVCAAAALLWWAL